MELRHLRYFLAVAELGTVTAAAAHLRVAQPAVSRQVQALERELGVQLFDRRGPRLTLTHAGRELRRIGTDLVDRSDRVETAAKHLGQGTLSRVTIAAADTTITEIVAPFVASLAPDDVFVSVEMVGSEEVHAAVRANCDLGIAATHRPSDGLASEPLTTVPLRAYVSSSHPWATTLRFSVSIAELVEETLVLPIPADPTRGVLDDAVSDESLTYGEHEEVPAPRLAQALAASGRGVGIATDLPRFGAYPVFILERTGGPVCLPIHATWDRSHYATGEIRQLVSRLKRFSESEVHDAAWRP